ncbi:hypothetical protein, partial [Bradyrhizobium sp. NBAIM08]|uniref:hypothetical protein n=1 Tax=Bradyrhizobium sp. NBAIM08 TaxID=2793815 RepID=UPI001CD73B67
MTLFPDSAPAQLGFDAVRARLVHHALGAEAADRLAALGPLGSAAAVREALTRTAELADLLRFDDPVPFGAVLDLREALRRIAPEGGTALPEDLLALRRTLETVRRLAAYFGARRAKAPAMAALAAGLAPLPDLEALLGRVVDDDGTVKDTASPELARLRKTLARTSAALRDAVMDELRRAREAGYAAEEQPTVRGGRLVLPIRAEAKRKI